MNIDATLGIIGLVASATAVILAALAYWRASQKPTVSAFQKRLRECEAGLLECLDAIDKLTVVAKRKYSRDAARESRATTKQKDGLPDPTTDPEGWKKEMMRRRVLGAN